MFASSESFEPYGQVDETQNELHKFLKSEKNSSNNKKSFYFFSLHDFQYFIIAPSNSQTASKTEKEKRPSPPGPLIIHNANVVFKRKTHRNPICCCFQTRAREKMLKKVVGGERVWWASQLVEKDVLTSILKVIDMWIHG